MQIMSQYIKSCKADYLRITLDIKDIDIQDLILLNMQGLACSMAKKSNADLKQILHPQGGYEFVLRVPLFSENFNYTTKNEEIANMFIKCSPKASDRKFIAFELKGHPYKTEQWYCVRLFLEHILSVENYEKYWEEIKITDVHIALGYDLHLSELLFDKLRARKAGLYYNQSEPETVYFQPQNKAMQIAVYDRYTKVRKRGLNFQPKERTRAELKLGRQTMLLKEFITEHTYLDKFYTLKAYNIQKIKNSQIFSKYELLALQAMGLTPFLCAHNAYEKSKIRRNLKPYLIPVTNLIKIKAKWLKEVKRMKVMDPSTNISNANQTKFKGRFRDMYL